MTDARRPPATPRADKVVRGLWRLRLPLPWEATPHGNAYAIRAGDGIVLFDTGFGGPDGMRNLELALAQAGLRVADIRLLVCTHTHADHYGCAASIVEAAGCPVWLHPAWGHVRDFAEDPDRVLERRLESGRANGVPEELLARLEAARRGAELGVDGAVPPDRELLDGVEVETDLGAWRVYEAPGHAPSHVVLHQPERRLLLSGDALVGKVFLFFDFGHTPDPAGEFLRSLEVIEGLDVGLCVSGHGRPFRDIPVRVAAYRAEFEQQLGRVREALASEPRTAYEVITEIIGGSEPSPAIVGYMLEMTLSYLTHLAALGEARELAGGEPYRWKRS